MKPEFEHRKEGKKHYVSVRYENEQKEEIYRVFEGSTKKVAMKRAKEAINEN